jgi:hypothetical protein
MTNASLQNQMDEAMNYKNQTSNELQIDKHNRGFNQFENRIRNGCALDFDKNITQDDSDNQNCVQEAEFGQANAPKQDRNTD